MLIRTVGNLEEHLTKHELSPEKLAEKTKISNMTIRRILKKGRGSPNTKIPEKYHAQFDHYLSESCGTVVSLNPEPTDFKLFLKKLEQDGEKVSDLKSLEKDLKNKLKDRKIGQTIRSHAKTMIDAVFSKNTPMRYKAVCIGALLYLINPFDLIPDSIPVIGYLDDFAVLSLAVAYLATATPPTTFDPDYREANSRKHN